MSGDSFILGNKMGHFGARGHEATGRGGVLMSAMQSLSDASEVYKRTLLRPLIQTESK